MQTIRQLMRTQAKELVYAELERSGAAGQPDPKFLTQEQVIEKMWHRWVMEHGEGQLELMGILLTLYVEVIDSAGLEQRLWEVERKPRDWMIENFIFCIRWAVSLPTEALEYEVLKSSIWRANRVLGKRIPQEKAYIKSQREFFNWIEGKSGATEECTGPMHWQGMFDVLVQVLQKEPFESACGKFRANREAKEVREVLSGEPIEAASNTGRI